MQAHFCDTYYNFSVKNLIPKFYYLNESRFTELSYNLSSSPALPEARAALAMSALMPAPAEITAPLLIEVNGQICQVQRMDKTSLDILDWNLILFLDWAWCVSWMCWFRLDGTESRSCFFQQRSIFWGKCYCHCTLCFPVFSPFECSMTALEQSL